MYLLMEILANVLVINHSKKYNNSELLSYLVIVYVFFMMEILQIYTLSLKQLLSKIYKFITSI